MKISHIIFTLNLHIFLCESALIAVTDSRIDRCFPEKEVVFDLSNYQHVPINDTLTVINGTLTFKRRITSPWKVLLSFQIYDRGEWLQKLKKTVPDACPELYNPMSIAYFYSKYLPKCPIEAGSVARFNEVPATADKWILATIPGEFAGRYRMVMNFESQDKNGKHSDCYKVYMDGYDIY